jgi:hypothetical protein
MLRWLLQASCVLVFVLTIETARAQPERDTEFTVVLDDKFEAMKVPIPKGWKLASDFKSDRDTTGFIVHISHAKPIPVPKVQTFVGGPKKWFDVAVRYPFRLTHRHEGKPTEFAIAKGEIRGTASPLKVKDLGVASTRYELRIAAMDELAREAAQEVITEGGVHQQVRFALLPLIATPDPNLVGGVLAQARRGKTGVEIVVAMKNRLPVRASGTLSTYAARNERFRFDLKAGEAKNIIIPVEADKLKGRPQVNMFNLKLEPPPEK